jgi:hypothetical protein
MPRGVFSRWDHAPGDGRNPDMIAVALVKGVPTATRRRPPGRTGELHERQRTSMPVRFLPIPGSRHEAFTPWAGLRGTGFS